MAEIGAIGACVEAAACVLKICNFAVEVMEARETVQEISGTVVTINNILEETQSILSMRGQNRMAHGFENEERRNRQRIDRTASDVKATLVKVTKFLYGRDKPHLTSPDEKHRSFDSSVVTPEILSGQQKILEVLQRIELRLHKLEEHLPKAKHVQKQASIADSRVNPSSTSDVPGLTQNGANICQENLVGLKESIVDVENICSQLTADPTDHGVVVAGPSSSPLPRHAASGMSQSSTTILANLFAVMQQDSQWDFFRAQILKALGVGPVERPVAGLMVAQPLPSSGSRPPVDVNLDFDKEISTSILRLAKEGCEYMRIKSLLESTRIDANVMDDEGRTALHYAAWHGDVRTVRELLKHDADVDMRVGDQDEAKSENALRIAVCKEHHDVVQELVKRRANVCMEFSGHMNVLHHAIQQESTMCTSLLLGSPRWRELVTSQDDAGQTALHRCAVSNKVEHARILLQSTPRLDMCVVDRENKTPLQLLLNRSNREGMVDLLLDLQPRPDVVLYSNDEKSALKGHERRRQRREKDVAKRREKNITNRVHCSTPRWSRSPDR